MKGYNPFQKNRSIEISQKDNFLELGMVGENCKNCGCKKEECKKEIKK